MDDDVTITEKDVIETMDIFTRVPSFLLKRWVKNNKNLVKTFEGQIEGYKENISDYDMVRLNKVLEMSTEELQDILSRAYKQNNKKQLKILADPRAKTFIDINMQELKRVLDSNSK